MACDLSTLATLDTQDVEQLMQVVDQCKSAMTDPRLWWWAIVFTVACAAVGALIGRFKHAVVRDAILGAALGPIGWIVSLCLPAARPQPRCLKCGQAAGAGDLHCRRCGAKLANSRTAPAGAGRPGSSG